MLRKRFKEDPMNLKKAVERLPNRRPCQFSRAESELRSLCHRGQRGGGESKQNFFGGQK